MVSIYCGNVFLRGLCAIYVFAFGSLMVQFDGLYGRQGLEPIEAFLMRMEKQYEVQSIEQGFLLLPSVVWGYKWMHVLPVGYFMELVCGVGLSIATLGVWGKYNGLSLLVLWVLYYSLCQVGQTFLSFQWDILLLEVGSIAIFMTPFLVGKEQPSKAIEKCMQFVLFKLMLMSGVVKLQSKCPTWLKLTALDFHYATQCLPTPLAWYAHQLPSVWQKLGVAGTFVIEGPATLLLIVPNSIVQKIGAWLQVGFQLAIIATGNYTFFNLLTVLLCIPFIDRIAHSQRSRWSTMALYFGTFVYIAACFYSMFTLNEAYDISLAFSVQQMEHSIAIAMPPIYYTVFGSMVVATIQQLLVTISQHGRVSGILRALHLLFMAFVGTNLLMINFQSLTQLQPGRHTQYDVPNFMPISSKMGAHLRLSAPYGLFRTMTGVGEVTALHAGKVEKIQYVARPEIIIEGTNDSGVSWHEYHFRYKPGNVLTAPKFIAPYQPRLDWQMWFAALGSYQQNPWFISLIDKLLKGKSSAKLLLDAKLDPFPDNSQNMIRATLYHYDFTRLNAQQPKVYPLANSSAWWGREKIREYLPAIERNNPSVDQFLRTTGLQVPNDSIQCSIQSDVAYIKLESALCQFLSNCHEKDNCMLLVASAVFAISAAVGYFVTPRKSNTSKKLKIE